MGGHADQADAPGAKLARPPRPARRGCRRAARARPAARGSRSGRARLPVTAARPPAGARPRTPGRARARSSTTTRSARPPGSRPAAAADEPRRPLGHRRDRIGPVEAERAEVGEAVGEPRGASGERAVGTARDAARHLDRRRRRAGSRRPAARRRRPRPLTRLQRPAAAAKATRRSSSETWTPSAISWTATPGVVRAAPASPGSRALSGVIALKRCVTARAPAANARRASFALASLCPSQTATPRAEAEVDQLERAGQLGGESHRRHRAGIEQPLEQRRVGRAQVLCRVRACAVRREERPFEMNADDPSAEPAPLLRLRDPRRAATVAASPARDQRRLVGSRRRPAAAPRRARRARRHPPRGRRCRA